LNVEDPDLHPPHIAYLGENGSLDATIEIEEGRSRWL